MSWSWNETAGSTIILHGNNAEISVHGISLNAEIDKPKIPKFLTEGIGVSSLVVTENDVFEANFTAPIFNLPISAIGDFGPQDPLSIDVLGIRFRIK